MGKIDDSQGVKIHEGLNMRWILKILEKKSIAFGTNPVYSTKPRDGGKVWADEEPRDFGTFENFSSGLFPFSNFSGFN